jgi:short-subunit dehydrogenase
MLKNKTLVICGATGTIGKSLSLMLASKGAKLILIAKNKERLRKLGEHLIKRHQHDPLLCPIDFLTMQPNDAKDLFDEIGNYTETLDGLIHAAGLAPPLCPVSELSSKDYLNTLQVNAHAKFYLSQQAIPYLKKSPKGQLIFCEPKQSNHKAFHLLEQMTQQMINAYVTTLNEESEQTSLKATMLSLPAINSPYRQKGYPFEDKSNNYQAKDLEKIWMSLFANEDTDRLQALANA